MIYLCENKSFGINVPSESVICNSLLINFFEGIKGWWSLFSDQKDFSKSSTAEFLQFVIIFYDLFIFQRWKMMVDDRFSHEPNILRSNPEATLDPTTFEFWSYFFKFSVFLSMWQMAHFHRLWVNGVVHTVHQTVFIALFWNYATVFDVLRLDFLWILSER